jgi:hypothetical protein
VVSSKSCDSTSPICTFCSSLAQPIFGSNLHHPPPSAFLSSQLHSFVGCCRFCLCSSQTCKAQQSPKCCSLQPYCCIHSSAGTISRRCSLRSTRVVFQSYSCFSHGKVCQVILDAARQMASGWWLLQLSYCRHSYLSFTCRIDWVLNSTTTASSMTTFAMRRIQMLKQQSRLASLSYFYNAPLFHPSVPVFFAATLIIMFLFQQAFLLYSDDASQLHIANLVLTIHSSSGFLTRSCPSATSA